MLLSDDPEIEFGCSCECNTRDNASTGFDTAHDKVS
jgi:hypothetical protein